MILGIDNGLSGALCVLSEIPGLPPVALIPLPVVRVVRNSRLMGRDKVKARASKAKEKAETNELDAVALRRIIRSLGPAEQITVFFEECPDHADRASTMRSMANTAGKIMAVLELCGLHGSTIRIQSHTWQPDMLGKVPRGQTKVYAEAAARRLWPAQDWRKTTRARVADTGFIDAALIAEWGRLYLSRNVAA